MDFLLQWRQEGERLYTPLRLQAMWSEGIWGDCSEKEAEDKSVKKQKKQATLIP